MRWLAVISLVGGLGCSDDGGSIHCVPPPTIEYSCEPITDSTYGCMGGPVWLSHYTGPAHYEDPDKVFPVGCVATLPECPCCWPTPRSVTCLAGTSEPNDAGVDGPVGPALWSSEGL